MARMKSNASLDEQIEKAQERLQKAKAQYDSVAADLRKLLEERDCILRCPAAVVAV